MRVRVRVRVRVKARVRARVRARARVRRSRSRPLSRRNSSTSSGGRRLAWSRGVMCPPLRVRGRARVGLGVGCAWHGVEAVREYLEAHLECEDQCEAHVEGEEHLGRDRG